MFCRFAKAAVGALVAGNLEESTAFRRLQEFARKVATELARVGVAHDTYVAHKSHQEAVTTPGGLFRRARTEIVLAPNRMAKIDGWRVFSEEQKETLLRDVAGTIRSTRYTILTLEVWLLRSGRLVVVELHEETVANNIRGSLPNVAPTRVHSQRDLDYRTARGLDGRSEWRDKETKLNGMVRTEEWRHYHEAKPSTSPCVTLSKHLAELRKRAG
jgi:hypothetical protein